MNRRPGDADLSDMLAGNEGVEKTLNDSATWINVPDKILNDHFTVLRLQELCDSLGLPRMGRKTDLIARLVEDAKLTYFELKFNDLERIAGRLGLAGSGEKDSWTKDKLIKSIVAAVSKNQISVSETPTDKEPSTDSPPSQSEVPGARKPNESNSINNDSPFILPLAHLNRLSNASLSRLCKIHRMRYTGTKPELAQRLEGLVRYDELVDFERQQIVRARKLHKSESTRELIHRIGDLEDVVGLDLEAMKGVRVVPFKSTGAGKGSDDDRQVSRETYKARLKANGKTLRDDQHISHIIAEKNGGVNHPDNYIITNAKLNGSLQHYHDHVFAYIAGLEQTRMAVEISRRLSGYNGPDADELVARGEQAFRMMVRQEEAMRAIS